MCVCMYVCVCVCVCVRVHECVGVQCICRLQKNFAIVDRKFNLKKKEKTCHNICSTL